VPIIKILSQQADTGLRPSTSGRPPLPSKKPARMAPNLKAARRPKVEEKAKPEPGQVPQAAAAAAGGVHPGKVVNKVEDNKADVKMAGGAKLAAESMAAASDRELQKVLYDPQKLTQPIKSAVDKFELLPAFLKVWGFRASCALRHRPVCQDCER
jgi:hypothetical protein